MSNPLFDMLGGMPTQSNAPMQIIQDFMKFKSMFQGNAQQQVQQMLQSGMIDQTQLNSAVQQAQMLQQMLGQR